MARATRETGTTGRNNALFIVSRSKIDGQRRLKEASFLQCLSKELRTILGQLLAEARADRRAIMVDAHLESRWFT